MQTQCILFTDKTQELIYYFDSNTQNNLMFVNIVFYLAFMAVTDNTL